MKRFEGYTKGVNLGGWLSQCDHTEERYSTFITEEDIRILAGWGIDHIRVPVDYDLVEDAEGGYREAGFSHIQDALDWAGCYGLNMILDLHKTAGFSFDKGEAESGFFEEEAYQERFYRLWEEFAKRFGMYRDRLAFELLNEVTDQAYCDSWNRIAGTCIRRIRAIAPTIDILVGGYYNNSVEAVKDLLLPPDEHIVYNFHCYEPIVFTHQGAYWIPAMEPDFRISLGSTIGELEEATERQVFPGWEGYGMFPPEERMSSAFFKTLFEEAVCIAEERDVRLYCGEYGVIDLASPEETLSWYGMIHEAFEAYGIGRAAWSYKEMDFGLSDKRMDSVREKLLHLM